MGGGNKSSTVEAPVDQSAVDAQNAAAQAQQQQQQLQWESEMAATNEANNSTNALAQQGINQNQGQLTAQQQRDAQQNADQQSAQAATGALSGAKAAATQLQSSVDPTTQKLAQAGITGASGLPDLNALLQKRAMNSNYTGVSGNNIQNSTATLGGN